MRKLYFNDTDTLIFDGWLDTVIPSDTRIKASISDKCGRLWQCQVLQVVRDEVAQTSQFRLYHAPLPAGSYYLNVLFDSQGFVSSCESIALIIYKSPTPLNYS